MSTQQRGHGMPRPTDNQLWNLWHQYRLDTSVIAQHFFYPEASVESRLWKLRDERRQAERTA